MKLDINLLRSTSVFAFMSNDRSDLLVRLADTGRTTPDSTAPARAGDRESGWFEHSFTLDPEFERNAEADALVAPTAQTLPTDPEFANQWHLVNDTPGELDLNVADVWADYTGAGVQIAVADGGFDMAHQDLDDNFLVGLGYDYVFADFDPSPYDANDNHGTSVAGIIGAEQGNDYGVVGVAYDASLVGYNVLGGGEAPDWGVMFLDAAGLGDGVGNTNGNANGSDILNMSLGISAPWITYGQLAGEIAALETVSAQGRDGLGMIVVKSNGNNRNGNEGTLEGWNSSKYTVSIGALRADGWVTDYSTPGANLLVSAFADDTNNNGAILTTDQTGAAGYTGNDFMPGFNGTSAAAPEVSGVVALILEANPDLGWRDVQKILAYSARHVGSEVDSAANADAPANGGFEQATQTNGASWFFNGASDWNGGGLHFSNDYGFGLVDAKAAVRLAETWQDQSTSANDVEFAYDVDGDAAPTVIDNDTAVFTFTVGDEIKLEHVRLDVTFSTTFLADIEVFLESPDGTRVQLAAGKGDSGDFNGTWSFGATAFWGEASAGEWTFTFNDAFDGDPLTITDIDLILSGAPVSEDDLFIFTHEFSDYAALASHSTLFAGGELGVDTINTAAVDSNTTINLFASTGTVDGVAITMSGIEQVFTGDGDDTLVGTDSANLLSGGRGNDRLFGERGDDTLIAGAGNDFISGGRGFDTIDGGAGDDTIFGGINGDIITGGDGADFIYGEHGFDDIDGGAGDDFIDGGDSNDTLNGRAGADILIGGAGADSLYGGADNDQFFIGDSDDLVIDGGGGDDILHLTASVDLSAVMEFTGIEWLYAGFNTVTVAAGQLDGVRLQDISTIQLATGGASIIGGVNQDVPATLEGSAFDDQVTLKGNQGWTVNAGDGADVILGTFGDDTINGGAGNDQIFGRDGFNTLNGGLGEDSIEGGDKRDVIDGGDGSDFIQGGGGLDLLYGGAGDDFITGGLRGDVIEGGAGADRIFGDEGKDTLYGQDGDDLLSGGESDDFMNGGRGNDVMLGDAGQDLLIGNDGDDFLAGGDGIDELRGGAGADTLYGGAARDLLMGGEGADIFEYISASDSGVGAPNRDRIVDFSEEDLIDLSAIDADVNTIGEQAFSLVGAFSNTAGEMVWDASNDLLSMDVNGDGVADMEILIRGTFTLDETDFILIPPPEASAEIDDAVSAALEMGRTVVSQESFAGHWGADAGATKAQPAASSIEVAAAPSATLEVSRTVVSQESFESSQPGATAAVNTALFGVQASAIDLDVMAADDGASVQADRTSRDDAWLSDLSDGAKSGFSTMGSDLELAADVMEVFNALGEDGGAGSSAGLERSGLDLAEFDLAGLSGWVVDGALTDQAPGADPEGW